MEETNERMKKSTVIGVIIVLLLILVGSFVWVKYGDSWFKKGEVQGVDTENPEPTMTITAKHQFKGASGTNRHIIAGEVNLPTPCHILNTDALVAESFPEQVTVRFTSSSQAEVCAQVLTTNRFKVEFTASENATIKATWNSKPANFNLIPAAAGEDLTNFELFLKA